MPDSIIRRFLRAAAPAVLALALVLLLHGAALACPGCKEGLAANDPAGVRSARGYFWSILFMLSMPPAILCTLGGYFYYEVRRARADRARIAERQLTAEQPATAKCLTNADAETETV